MAKPSARVLVVDDEPLCRWALRESLLAAGFDVIEMDGEAPLRPIEDVDVLVLDTTLAQAGALRVLEHVRALNPRCRVLLLTSFDDVSLARLATRSRSWRAVQKPFDINEVVSIVTDLSKMHTRGRSAA